MVLRWERVTSEQGDVYRAKVPGGWFVQILYGLRRPAVGDPGKIGAFFYPDPEHKWGLT